MLALAGPCLSTQLTSLEQLIANCAITNLKLEDSPAFKEIQEAIVFQ